eukprot:355897-Chlamydomonas_euryale.AAC.2
MRGSALMGRPARHCAESHGRGVSRGRERTVESQLGIAVFSLAVGMAIRFIEVRCTGYKKYPGSY